MPWKTQDLGVRAVVAQVKKPWNVQRLDASGPLPGGLDRPLFPATQPMAFWRPIWRALQEGFREVQVLFRAAAAAHRVALTASQGGFGESHTAFHAVGAAQVTRGTHTSRTGSVDSIRYLGRKHVVTLARYSELGKRLGPSAPFVLKC